MRTRSMYIHSLSLGLLLSVPLILVGEDERAPASGTEIIVAAREVYEGLFEAAQKDEQLSPAEIESLNAWSARIELQELSAIGIWDAIDLMRTIQGALPPNVEELGQATRNSMRDHAARLKQVETLTNRKLLDHTADKTTVASARYFRLVADSVLQQMDARIAAAKGLQFPRPSALTGEPFIVIVNAKSELIVEKKKVSMRQLAEILTRVFAEKNFGFVEVKASGEALHDHVIAIMDLASDAGFEVTLSTVD